MPQSKNSLQVRADGLADVLATIGGNGSQSSSPMTVFRNPVSGQGTARDRLMYSQLSYPELLTRDELDSLYMHWICRRVVDYVADEITRAGWMVQLGADSNAQAVPGVDRYLRNLEAEMAFNEAIKAGRQYGGAAVVVYVNDGRRAEDPIDWNNIRSITGLEPVDRWYLKPDIQVDTVNYSRPQRYELIQHDQLNPGPIKIHSDRILRIEGRRLPFRLRQHNNGWGLSEIQPILEALARYSGSMGDVHQMLADLDLFTHKIKGLATMLASGKEKQVRDRLAVNDLSRSQYRGFAIDADKEEIEFNSRNCSGLAEVLTSLKEELVGATGFPATLLFGESPKGIGSTGRGEERDFSRTVDTYRDTVVRRPLMKLAYMAMKAKDCDTNGIVPEEWTVNFPSLFLMNEREIADLRARNAATDYRYWLMGAVTSSEIAMSRFAGAEYSGETTIDMAQREEDGTLKEDKLKLLLRTQGKMDPVEQMELQEDQTELKQPDGPPGIRGLSKTGERSDPTDNENGSLPIDGSKSISSEDLDEDS